ncbi:uncharacterized protein PHALS_05173 [Plasmopara halstedii]|uniref:RxLR-like protein n=1 Tax=Plasmopara halstedii TaxID=4781 RepID=A0A0P1B0E1_PLAHL|nr:uncharacterized protein PHALS_05173 [Plasmopara halstedii]CEG47842.1 hypothetical protein PHALS_05173 [Plasmopara halstedii]|eukprot:XP_024584211.1 hypothetical protein PHALS_05173 [Plasmopara halstedii]
MKIFKSHKFIEWMAIILLSCVAHDNRYCCHVHLKCMNDTASVNFLRDISTAQFWTIFFLPKQIPDEEDGVCNEVSR